MADFDPQQPADKKPQNGIQNTDDSGSAGGGTAPGGAESSQDWSDFGRTVPATTARQWEFSHSCCDSRSTADCQEPDDCGAKSSRDESPAQAFFADWSAAEARSEATSSAAGAEAAAPFQPRRTPSSQPETFWVELVRSQVSDASQRTELARVSQEAAAGAQSKQFWSDLVASQRPTSDDVATWPSASSRPAGMGWSDEEAAEWSPPERETEYGADRDAEAVEAGGEAVGADASARRDGLEWSVPATASEEWAAARSEGLGETKSLMAAAVEAAQPGAQAGAQAKLKKPRAAKPASEKKPAAKKTAAKKPAAKAKKPAVKKTAAARKPAAKKPAARKVAKKAAPPPKITKAPTRRAA